MSTPLGLYLHVPFCGAICTYCNFNRGLFDAALERRYVAALGRDIARAGDGRRVDSIFFGGGTPSLLDPASVQTLLAECRHAFAVDADAEVTLEANPESITVERLQGYLNAGVNRLSVGVQSFDDAELARLGRVHSAERAQAAIGEARDAGFTNVSLDLMLWLPGQTFESWRRTVMQAIDLGTEHLSLYLLELYPNAPLKEAMARASAGSVPGRPDGWRQPTDDDAADMYLEALSLLDAAGYRQYEISNVARDGRASRHNLKYWQSGHWLGLGCGAHSTVDGVRWKNVSSTVEYVDRIGRQAEVREDLHQLSDRERREEALFTGLRLSDGIDRRNFLAKYGVDPWQDHQDTLAPLVDAGLIWQEEGSFGLSRAGMLVANEILLNFV